MYTIKTLNNIAPAGLAKLGPAQFKVDNEADTPQGILVRSAKMHEMELPESLLAIGRAGAGVNNIPVEKCSEAGVVVFNTPGANAGGVAELTIGGLVRGLTFDDIMLGVSALRNKKLANVFYRLRLIEAYGTGILRINECYADSEVKPLFEVTDNAFKITLPNRNFTGERKETTPAVPARTKDKAQRQDTILRLAKKQGAVTRKDVETALQVSQSTAILILREMVDKGLLVKDGMGKHLQYRVSEN